ncbi:MULTISPECIES: ATP-dependent Clp protease proteolytic subunit [unclassified Yoonia]|uniref:ATP-dependent Clp protease proteolytic subunit n=1 Tax=unclassified Yoonia TaxID=2629118 RepID=UPI002AFF77C4|nr:MULTISPECIES: hypothetical protein [unclassified Yoonia]
MSQPVPAKPSRMNIGRALKLIFVLQIGIAGVMMANDLSSRWQLDLTLSAPAPTGPVAPGDQVRRYDPSRPTPEFSDPGRRPAFNMPDNLPPQLTFTIEDAPDVGQILMMHGAIDQGDAERLATYLTTLDEIPDTVSINSPGGSVDEALLIGRLIREQELNTHVLPGMACLSACPYLLAGGVAREVSLTGAVGLHQHYYETPGYIPAYFAVEDIQRSQGAVMRYLIEMGVDAGVMVYGLNTPPDDIYVLVEDELLESRLATAVTE